MKHLTKYCIYEIRHIEGSSMSDTPTAYYLKHPERRATKEEIERRYDIYGRITVDNKFDNKEAAQAFLLSNLIEQNGIFEYVILEVYTKML